jgi:Ca2+-dependent lipid-binding protein
MGILTVVLEKVTHLKDQDLLGTSDPYVKFELEQDNLLLDKNFGEKKSSRKKSELSPVYNETFTFENLPGLKNLELTCKIIDDDKLDTDKMGKCKIKLEDLNLGPHPIMIDRVVDANLFSKDARIYLRLSYTE